MGISRRNLFLSVLSISSTVKDGLAFLFPEAFEIDDLPLFLMAGSAICFKHLEGEAFSIAGSAGVAAFTKVAFATDIQKLALAKESAPDKIKTWLGKKPDSAFTKVHGHRAKRDCMASSTVEAMNGADSSAYRGTAIRSHRPGKALQEMVVHSVRRHDARAAQARACSPDLKITPGMANRLQERK